MTYVETSTLTQAASEEMTGSRKSSQLTTAQGVTSHAKDYQTSTSGLTEITLTSTSNDVTAEEGIAPSEGDFHTSLTVADMTYVTQGNTLT